jgi:acetyl-CoA carboxylase carboxyltransferase component
MTQKYTTIPSLLNPFSQDADVEFKVPGQVASMPGIYEDALRKGYDLIQRPYTAAGIKNIQRQHLKNRMTVWERIKVLTDKEPTILFQNWGPNLDGAGLVTAIIDINGQDVALYGHDFTVRAGSMDATNGKKIGSII